MERTQRSKALGLTLPGASSIPAVDSGHVRMALNCGERIVKMIWEDFRPKDLLTMKAFENAITPLLVVSMLAQCLVLLVAQA